MLGRWQFLAVVGVAVAGYFVISFAGLVVNGYQLNQRAGSLQRDIQGLRDDNEQLESQIRALLTEDAVEKLAREELGWTKPGETAVIIVPSNPDAKATAGLPVSKSAPDTPNWRRWWDLFLGSPLP